MSTNIYKLSIFNQAYLKAKALWLKPKPKLGWGCDMSSLLVINAQMPLLRQKHIETHDLFFPLALFYDEICSLPKNLENYIQLFL